MDAASILGLVAVILIAPHIGRHFALLVGIFFLTLAILMRLFP